jgi:hypothetical protein
MQISPVSRMSRREVGEGKNEKKKNIRTYSFLLYWKAENVITDIFDLNFTTFQNLSGSL